MDFEALLEMLRVGADDMPSTIYDDIGSIYRESLENYNGAILQQDILNTRIQELESEISKLKNANYDLMVNGHQNEMPETDDEDDENDEGIESLFKNGEDK